MRYGRWWALLLLGALVACATPEQEALPAPEGPVLLLELTGLT